MIKPKTVFITGSTGVLGRHILKQLLFQKNIEIFLLIRGTNQESCLQKYEKLLREIVKDKKVSARISVVRGDVTKPYLGINKKTYIKLSKIINHIFHCAANVDYYQLYKKGGSVNVVSAKNIIKFSNNCSDLYRLNYISTAFIAGNSACRFEEDKFDINQAFNGSYEKSKFEAEALVRDAFNNKYDITIYRPSAIVGEYSNGEIANFQMFYQFFRSLSLNLFTVLPINFNGVFNLIPCDYAAKAILVLSQNKINNATYHIISPKNFTIKELIAFGAKQLKCNAPIFSNINNYDQKKYSINEKKLLEIYLPFLDFRPIFYGNKTLKELNRLGFKYPPLDKKYLIKLFDYAIYKGYLKRN